MSAVVLVVVAHADDEVLGCGGTIASHVYAGDAVHVLFMADGVTSRDGASSEDQSSRGGAAELAQKILGIRSIQFLDFPDNRMDSMALLDIVQPLESVIKEISPQIIYTHHFGDLNIDHRLTYQAVMTACRPMPGGSVRDIFTFEVMSSTEWEGADSAIFRPNVFVDITLFWAQKCKAVEAYSMEMRAAPHSRSLEHLDALSRHRGHTVGLMRAEAFSLIRSIKST
jgi:LmbE family N-acetylglucosaminyl deacetylase